MVPVADTVMPWLPSGNVRTVSVALGIPADARFIEGRALCANFDWCPSRRTRRVHGYSARSAFGRSSESGLWKAFLRRTGFCPSPVYKPPVSGLIFVPRARQIPGEIKHCRIFSKILSGCKVMYHSRRFEGNIWRPRFHSAISRFVSSGVRPSSGRLDSIR